jgi:cytosine/adenosine deaminase-related metal-dependent hydrolase
LSLYLRDAAFVDWRDLSVSRGDFLVEEGRGGAVSPAREVPPDAETLDCAGRVVTRAFAIAHHHIYSTLSRGMPPPPRAPRSFREKLELVWWKLDRQLDADMLRTSALACGVEALRNGCTFIIDHHSSPSAVSGSLSILAEALEEVGLGHLLCYELSDRDGQEVREEGLEETAQYLAGHHGLVGLHASFTVSDELLEQAVALANAHDTGVHVHVAEAESDQLDCRERYGTTVVERLARAGALASPRSLLVHGLYLSQPERELLAASEAWLVQCSESNQNNGLPPLDPRGLEGRLLIGTDGMHSDPLQASRSAYLADHSQGCTTPLDAYHRLRRVHDYLELGGAGGGGENDLVVLDYPTPTPVDADNWAAHVVYALGSRHVRSVIRQGRLVVQDGCVLTVDESAVLFEARAQAQRLWERL